MSHTVTIKRPKLNTTLDKNVSIQLGTPIESGTKTYIPIRLVNLNPDTQSLSGLTWVTGSPTITGASGSFTTVIVGSVFEGEGGDGVDVASGATVTAKTATTLTLSSNMLTDSTVYGATATATTNPADGLDATLAVIEVNLSASGSTVTLPISVRSFDGTNISDANADDLDDTYATGGVNVGNLSLSLNLDQYLLNAGVARTNS